MFESKERNQKEEDHSVDSVEATYGGMAAEDKSDRSGGMGLEGLTQLRAKGEKGTKGGKASSVKGGKGEKGKGKGEKGAKGVKGAKGAKGAKGVKGGKGSKGGRGGEVSKTKTVLWNTISEHAVEDSVWGTVDAEEVLAKLDLSDIDNVFAKKKATKATGDGDAKPANPTGKKQKVSVLNASRSKNVEIMLSSIKISIEEVREALILYNVKSSLSDDNLDGIGKNIPSDEEAKAVREYDDPGLMSKADRYFLEILKVPNLGQAVSVSLFRSGFEKETKAVRAQGSIVIQACQEIRGSRKLAKVLEYVLALGNALNRGTSRGKASGFKLDGLLKFMNTKGTDGKTTLLHYLVATIASQSPDLQDFPEELPTVKSASNMVFSTMDTGLYQLQNGLSNAKAAAQSAPSEAALTDFIDTAGVSLAALESEMAGLRDEVWYVGAYFGEDLADGFGEGAEEPFRAVTAFAALFRDAVLENERQAELKKKAEARRATMAAKGIAKKKVTDEGGEVAPRGDLSEDFQNEMGAILAMRQKKMQQHERTGE